jgi:glyoxylase-like metal-dependent hydrolase (beta-lactamase superfamily II)
MPAHNHAHSRRQFLTTASLALTSTLLPVQNSFGASLLTGKIIKPVRKNVGMAMGPGGTIGWFIEGDATVIVDSQVKKSGISLAKQITSQDQKRQIDYLINTHHHADHIGGNAPLKAIAKEVVAQENCAKRMSRNPAISATTTFEDTWKRKIGSETVSLKHYGRAHTDGDAVVHFENANVVHVGDIVWNKAGPRVDHPGGCNVFNWIKVMEEIVKDHDNDTLYIFGHGTQRIGKKSIVLEFHTYLSRLVEHVEKEHKKGHSITEIVANTKNIPGADGWPPSPRTLRGAYAEITGKIEPVTHLLNPVECEACLDHRQVLTSK